MKRFQRGLLPSWSRDGRTFHDESTFPVLPTAAHLDRLDPEDVVKDTLMAYIRGPMVEKGRQGPLFALINTAGRVMLEAHALHVPWAKAMISVLCARFGQPRSDFCRLHRQRAELLNIPGRPKRYSEVGTPPADSTGVRS